MLTEKEIKALKNGAYGVTRSGEKAKYVGQYTNEEYSWAILDKTSNKIDEIIFDYLTFNTYYEKESNECDIVGLWQEKSEPFDLERALAGEPVLLQSGRKAYVKYKVDVDDSSPVNKYLVLQGYLEKENGTFGAVLNWDINGEYNSAYSSDTSIIGMWKEPTPESANAELPKPITEFGDLEEVWYIGFGPEGYMPFSCSIYDNKILEWSKNQRWLLKSSMLYKSKDDLIKVIEAITRKPYTE